MTRDYPKFKIGQQIKTVFSYRKGYVIVTGMVDSVIGSKVGYIYSSVNMKDSNGKIISKKIESDERQLFSIDTPDNVLWSDFYKAVKVVLEHRIDKLQQQLKMTKFKWQVAQKHSFHRDTDYENYVNEKLELKNAE